MVLRSSFHEILLEQRCALKLGLRGVKSFKCECILCILETRLTNEHAEDGDSRSFGLIRRWQVREPLLLIPKFDDRERFLLGSVKRLQDLQPNIPNLVCICPLDCWESRWLYG
ncbi:hypothetical protein BRADI_3g17926v3 [Brachypodium distachyon]|uniref:Uncharacterized protein n=1 Tax=Brachypodium distachyon TaxID=15368 RepID=A0A2K2CXW9_BRADI|nr:hypothetical protein BRADI_3g17926v3 [Brachypodium distachyon]